jgi:hypothetical protein
MSTYANVLASIQLALNSSNSCSCVLLADDDLVFLTTHEHITLRIYFGLKQVEQQQPLSFVMQHQLQLAMLSLTPPLVWSRIYDQHCLGVRRDAATV